ncbi:hypothetical protein SELMODRAFT_424030 [Selaginella moellendorffii]|uniref:Protein kinase domain-containing protein n=1 Tax=Selaginella moellendorffii TaxID=88036 RepID=D8SNK4_SELML|nr:hypothetical protein SELMODRAFT_424030 [Selaginella moellendorffii]
MFQSGREAGRELRLMSKLRGCAGVVSLAGFVRKRSGGACYGTMVMELCGPSLCHRLIKGGPLGEKEAAKTIQRLAEGLKGIHTSGIIHPNLKPENIFVKLDATAVHEVVIGDFGVATDDPKEMSQYCGTGNHRRVGVITYELLRGYKQSREIELFRAGEFPDGCPLSDEAEDFICGMPIERLTLDGVLEHPWIVENCSNHMLEQYKGVKFGRELSVLVWVPPNGPLALGVANFIVVFD